jgi:hypothetical protein
VIASDISTALNVLDGQSSVFGANPIHYFLLGFTSSDSHRLPKLRIVRRAATDAQKDEQEPQLNQRPHYLPKST